MTAKQIMAKAEGFVKGINAMTETERRDSPNKDFVSDYNQMKNQAATHFSEVKELLPPVITGELSTFGGYKYAVTYNEIRAYCEQIVALMPTTKYF